MTELTLKLRDDILAMVEVAKRVKAKEGQEWSDSLMSKLLFNHGEFVLNLRRWEGGNGGASMKTLLQFERFLIDNIGPVEHAKFLKGLGKVAAAPKAKPGDPASQSTSDWD